MRNVVTLIKKVAKQGTTILIVTHDHELISLACDRFICFENKTITQDITVSETTFPQIIDVLKNK